MITRLLVATTLVLGSSLVFAQVCSVVPGSVCLVPSRSASTIQATTYTTAYPVVNTSMVVPYSGPTVGMAPMMVMQPGCNVTNMSAYAPMASYQTMSSLQACPGNVSPDTACLLNQVAAMRNDIRSLQGTVRAAQLTSRGQVLVSRMNQLIAEESMFRQQIATNPNMPGAQATALSLTAQAEALNRDIADFNRELSAIPADQRPYVAADLNTFTTAYWNPAQTRFAEYRTNVGQAGATYQPAYAANPWLQSWLVAYQTDLNNISTDQQQYASVNWWGNMQVAGSTEVFPGGMMTTPNGQVIYIPAGTILTPMATTTTTTTAPR